MLLPPSLKPTETIGVYSPSTPGTQFAPKRTKRAVRFLQSKGFDIKMGSLTGAGDGYRSGSIEQRVDELNQLIRDPDVRCVMSAIGGSNSNSLLPYIDYDAIRKDPKIFVGYSDVTAILLGIYAQTGLTTFCGPSLTATLGEFSPLVDMTFDSFFTLACDPSAEHILHAPSHWSDEFLQWEEQDRVKILNENQWHFYGEGKRSGRLIGGNLNTMTAIWGSPYMPAIEPGDILLIEDSLKDIATVERLLAFLEINGVLDIVQAVLLGKHELFDDKNTGRTPLDVLREIRGDRPLSVVDGFDCCHTHPMLTMPIGRTVEIDFDRHTVSLISEIKAARSGTKEPTFSLK